MTVKIVTPPSVEPVSLAELREQLRIDHDDEVAILLQKISAARRHVESLTGLALAPATFDLTLDRFPAAEIAIPKAPLVSVTSVSFIGADGIEAVVSASNYVVDTALPQGWIVPVSDFSWPATMATINAVRVRFVAGYETPPENLKEAILQLAAWWYEQREAGRWKARQRRFRSRSPTWSPPNGSGPSDAWSEAQTRD